MWRNVVKGLEENFGLIATILGFVVDTITLAALISSNVAPSIPIVDVKLEKNAQLTIWTIATITYFGFLREYWLRLSRRIRTRPAPTFSGFIINDLFLGFKHPFHLIPIPILVGFLITIIHGLDLLSIAAWVVVAIVVATALAIVWEKRRQEEREEREWEIVNNPSAFDRWITRINKELEESGYATQIDLARKYSASYTLCWKLLKKFHEVYETERNLVFISETIYKPAPRTTQDSPGYTSVTIWVLTSSNLLNARPWLANKERYFSM